MPETVTALAFNVKAADEMKGRTEESFAGRSPHIRTINSLAYDICNETRGSRSAPGPQREWTHADSSRQRLPSVGGRIRTCWPPTSSPCRPSDCNSSTRARRRRIFPDAVGIGEGFDRYRSALADAGALDFDEQIYRAIEILVTQPGVPRASECGAAPSWWTSSRT